MGDLLPIAAYALPSAAGILFAIIGLAYRLGQARGISTPIVVWHMGCAGMLWFGFQAFSHGLPEAPPRVWVLGVSSGICQMVSILFVSMALARGPLSPIWCAMNLIFVPVIGYAALVLGQSVSPGKMIGVVAAVASVLVGGVALGDDGESAGGRLPVSLRRRLAYAVILLGALLSNSLLQIGITDLGGRGLMGGHGELFFMLVYAAMVLPFGIMFLGRRTRGVYSRKALECGAMAAIGSIGGMALLGLSSIYPASVVFTLSSILSLIGGGVFSVALFGERMTRPWFAMLGLAVLAVVLVSIG